MIGIVRQTDLLMPERVALPKTGFRPMEECPSCGCPFVKRDTGGAYFKTGVRNEWKALHLYRGDGGGDVSDPAAAAGTF